MELHELHILEWKAGIVCHHKTIASTNVRIRRDTPDAAITAGGEHYRLRMEGVNFAGENFYCDDPRANAILNEQLRHKIFAKEADVILNAILVKRVKHYEAGTISRIASTHNCHSLGIRIVWIQGTSMPAETSLGDLAFIGTRERHAH